MNSAFLHLTPEQQPLVLDRTRQPPSPGGGVPVVTTESHSVVSGKPAGGSPACTNTWSL